MRLIENNASSYFSRATCHCPKMDVGNFEDIKTFGFSLPVTVASHLR